MLDKIFCKSLSCTACRAGGCVGRDGAAGGTVGVAVAGRGVVVPDDEAEEVLLGPGEDCTLVGLQGKVVLQCNLKHCHCFKISQRFLITSMCQ